VKKPCLLFFALALAILPFLIQQQLLRAESAPGRRPVPSRFFGMTTHSLSHWPALQFAGLRLWCTGTSWADLNPSDGVYDWTRLDAWLAQAQQHGTTETILTLAMTPQWASSNPNDSSCRFGHGQCDPPADLNPDGSGSDQHWKDYITAVATHAKGQIKYWEIWDEPVNYYYWNGTFAQMVRMAKDARSIILSIDPTAFLLSPPNGASRPFGENWWKGYAELGGLNYADVIALHGGGKTTCDSKPVASDLTTAVANLRSIMLTYGVSTKPIWDTESNWGAPIKNCFYNQDLQAAFLAQFYMFHRSLDMRRFYWFAYDDTTTGQLWDPNTGKLTKGGVAYGYVHDWMQGATMTQDCSTSNNAIWTCGFSGPKGYLAEAIWDTNQSCKNGSCQTVNETVDSVYNQYRTLDGKTIPIQNNQVPIGAKPIFLENHSR
jgi:polysaccharide biosynthesis protein PslG